VILGTPLNAIVLTLLVKRQERRAAFFVVVVSVMELYGTVLYFATALFNGFAHIDTSSAWNLGVKFIGLNGLWVLFPALAIRAAFRDLLPAGAAARARQATATR
jgi:hypothetical protein